VDDCDKLYSTNSLTLEPALIQHTSNDAMKDNVHKQLMAVRVGHGKCLQTYTGLDRFA